MRQPNKLSGTSAGPAMNSVGRYRERARALYDPVTWTQAPRTGKTTRPEAETPTNSAEPMNAVGPPVAGPDAVVILAANALSEHDRVGRDRLGPCIAEALAAIGLATRGYDAPPVDRQGSVSPDAARTLRVGGPPAGGRVALRLAPRRARWVQRRLAARTDAAWDADRAPGPEHDGLRPLGWRAAHPVAHPGTLLAQTFRDAYTPPSGVR